MTLDARRLGTRQCSAAIRAPATRRLTVGHWQVWSFDGRLGRCGIESQRNANKRFLRQWFDLHIM